MSDVNRTLTSLLLSHTICRHFWRIVVIEVSYILERIFIFLETQLITHLVISFLISNVLADFGFVATLQYLHYLCKIGLEKMFYRSSWLYKSYTEESHTHITIAAYYNVDEAFLQASTATWGDLWDCRTTLRKLVFSVCSESDLDLPFGKN